MEDNETNYLNQKSFKKHTLVIYRKIDLVKCTIQKLTSLCNDQLKNIFVNWICLRRCVIFFLSPIIHTFMVTYPELTRTQLWWLKWELMIWICYIYTFSYIYSLYQIKWWQSYKQAGINFHQTKLIHIYMIPRHLNFTDITILEQLFSLKKMPISYTQFEKHLIYHTKLTWNSSKTTFPC